MNYRNPRFLTLVVMDLGAVFWVLNVNGSGGFLDSFPMKASSEGGIGLEWVLFCVSDEICSTDTPRRHGKSARPPGSCSFPWTLTFLCGFTFTAAFHAAPRSALRGAHSHCQTVFFSTEFFRGVGRNQKHKHLADKSSTRKLELVSASSVSL